MTLLNSHLEQIALSSSAITELPFPPPKIFTNALINTHDITSLIRDTEPHERALFTIDPHAKRAGHGRNARQRKGFAANSQNDIGMRVPRQGSAVAVALSKKLGEQVREEASRDRGDVDIEVLIKGAEKLCGIYPIPGAKDRISSQRLRLSQLTSSVDHYESRVSSQAGQLAMLNKAKRYTGDLEDNEFQSDGGDNRSKRETLRPSPEDQITLEDLEKEEEEIKELESRKRMLEDRVSGMERDLGGLLR